MLLQNALFRSTLLLVVVGSSSITLAVEEPKRPASPDLLVVRDGWNAQRDTVRKMLESTAAELWIFFPKRKLQPIVIYPRGGPITYFRRGPGGEFFIHMNTGNTFWAQYAYQFSHEFCHVLCQTDADEHGNDWFEESLCEMASMFAMRRMGETWKTDPPFEHWKNFAPHLTSYVVDLRKSAELGKDETLANWYAQHTDELHGSATKRELNRVVASALLPLFEETPEHWAAVGFLNEGKPDRRQTLVEFLTDWHTHSPERHRVFICRIAGEFGLTIPKDN